MLCYHLVKCVYDTIVYVRDYFFLLGEIPILIGFSSLVFIISSNKVHEMQNKFFHVKKLWCGCHDFLMVLNQIEVLLLWFKLGCFGNFSMSVGYLAWILSPMHSLCFGGISQLQWTWKKKTGTSDGPSCDIFCPFFFSFCLFSLRKLIYLFIF